MWLSTFRHSQHDYLENQEIYRVIILLLPRGKFTDQDVMDIAFASKEDDEKSIDAIRKAMYRFHYAGYVDLAIKKNGTIVVQTCSPDRLENPSDSEQSEREKLGVRVEPPPILKRDDNLIKGIFRHINP